MNNVAHRTDGTQKGLQLKPHPAVATMHLAVATTHPEEATTHPAVATMHPAVGVTRLAATNTPLAIRRQQAHPAPGLSCLPAMLQP